MKVESKINLQGTIISSHTTPTTITFVKGDQFNAEMDDTTGVIVDGKNMTLAAARRKWMHDKLHNWIDGVEE